MFRLGKAECRLAKERSGMVRLGAGTVQNSTGVNSSGRAMLGIEAFRGVLDEFSAVC